MSEGIPYADIVILGLIAVFVLLRLRSVLGQKNEGDEFFRPAAPPATDTIIQPSSASLKNRLREESDPYAATLSSGDVAEGIANLKTRDPLFTATSFLEGAKMAFEMVFDAFAKGDKQTLTMLLSPEIYSHFEDDLKERDAKENKPETTLLSVAAREIANITIDKNNARIAVRFESEQVTIERKPDGTILGDPSARHHAVDEWVFERDVTSKNPNWKIIET